MIRHLPIALDALSISQAAATVEPNKRGGRALLTGLTRERRGALSYEESLRREVHHFGAPASSWYVKCRPKAVGVANAGILVVCLHNKTTHDFHLHLIVALVRLLDRSEGSRAAAKEPGAIELFC